jgi:16S rRNA C967 or C1407 C5-methylase (RsmB/RsmF family)
MLSSSSLANKAVKILKSKEDLEKILESVKIRRSDKFSINPKAVKPKEVVLPPSFLPNEAVKILKSKEDLEKILESVKIRRSDEFSINPEAVTDSSVKEILVDVTVEEAITDGTFEETVTYNRAEKTHLSMVCKDEDETCKSSPAEREI